MRFLHLFAIAFLIVVTVTLGSRPQTLDAQDWMAPAMAVPGLEISGDPGVWGKVHAKALDRVHDGAEGKGGRGDLMGFYFDQESDRLSFRVNLFRAPGTSEREPLLEPGIRVFVLLDYEPGGTRNLPQGISGTAPLEWDRAVELRENGGALSAAIVDAGNDDRETERVRKAIASRRWGTAEASFWLPGGFEEAVVRAQGGSRGDYARFAPGAAAAESTPVEFYVFTTAGEGILDDLSATNLPLSNTHNVAFVQHLNQGLTYTTVFRGERGEAAAFDGDPNNPDDGADELLAAHDYYNLPVNWHQGGLLISAAEWHDPGFNDWLEAGALAGRYDILTSALGQHMMPFVRDEINGKSVDVENDLINLHYGYTPRVAWVPERVWVENPDNDGNGIDASANVLDFIGDDFWDNGVWAVVLDDYVHCGYNNGAFDDHHIYTYGGGKILPGDNDFVGQVNHDAGAAWNTILSGTSDEIIIYHNDAEIAAEVSQGAGNPSALNNYIWILQQCSLNSGTVGVWRLTDVLQDPGFTTQALTLQSGTYGLLGEWSGYGGGNNFWYGDWAGYTGPSNLDGHTPKWDYGTQWDFTLTKILGVPANNLSEMAWYILMTNLHETGWHDAGDISGWQHHYSNHIRSGNAHAEAARWVGGLYVDPTGAYTADFEDDGVDELVVYNDRLLAVFDTIGGKLQWLFAKGTGYDYSVVSNDNAFWVDTDGDFNETNHVAVLSDVSVGGSNKENDFYSFNVLTGSGNTVEAEIIHPSVTKTVSLTLGDSYLKVTYDAGGAEVFVKNGFTPDNLDLTWSGKSVERLWDPDEGGYFGFRNTNTQATGGLVVGTAGAQQNFQFEATLLQGDEFFGTTPFEVYVYGGFSSPLDGNGHVPELLALRDQLVDTFPPRPVSGTYFPSTDHLTVFFTETIDWTSVTATGFAIDDDDDGIADVTLTASDVLTTSADNSRLDFDLSAATAAAIEALVGSMELLMDPAAVSDVAANPNPQITHLDDVPVAITPPTEVQIDGLVTDADWDSPRKREEDLWDSLWNGGGVGDTNEINVLYVDWDDTYLYLGIQGHVQGNSWVLYLDGNVNGPAGYSDLTAIDTWERGATFTAPGFKPDFHYGAFQHQGIFDSHSLWRLTSDTTSVDVSSQAIMAFDPSHLNGFNGGSELAIPWDVIYGLGPGQVPPGAEIGVVASVCWDPEPNGELGGDSVPNNTVAVLPQIDAFCGIQVDTDSNGIPDPKSQTGLPHDRDLSGIRLLRAFPNPARAGVQIPLQLAGPGEGGRSYYQVRTEVFDLGGRRVQVLYSGQLPAGDHRFSWDGRTHTGADAGAGIFFVRVSIAGQSAMATKITRMP